MLDLPKINNFGKMVINVKNNDTAKLITIPVTSDSMEPTLKKGDVLLIDTCINKCSYEGIYYFFTDFGGMQIKRLQPVITGGMRVLCDNKERYSSEFVSENNINSIKICGRVVGICSVRKI